MVKRPTRSPRSANDESEEDDDVRDPDDDDDTSNGSSAVELPFGQVDTWHVRNGLKLEDICVEERAQINSNFIERHIASHENQRFSLAFSGGGVRAACFQMGVLWRLGQAGMLKHVEYISATSGGTWAAAAFLSQVAEEEEKLDRETVEEEALDRWYQKLIARAICRMQENLPWPARDLGSNACAQPNQDDDRQRGSGFFPRAFDFPIFLITIIFTISIKSFLAFFLYIIPIQEVLVTLYSDWMRDSLCTISLLTGQIPFLDSLCTKRTMKAIFVLMASNFALYVFGNKFCKKPEGRKTTPWLFIRSFTQANARIVVMFLWLWLLLLTTTFFEFREYKHAALRPNMDYSNRYQDCQNYRHQSHGFRCSVARFKETWSSRAVRDKPKIEHVVNTLEEIQLDIQTLKTGLYSVLASSCTDHNIGRELAEEWRLEKGSYQGKKKEKLGEECINSAGKAQNVTLEHMPNFFTTSIKALAKKPGSRQNIRERIGVFAGIAVGLTNATFPQNELLFSDWYRDYIYRLIEFAIDQPENATIFVFLPFALILGVLVFPLSRHVLQVVLHLAFPLVFFMVCVRMLRWRVFSAIAGRGYGWSQVPYYLDEEQLPWVIPCVLVFDIAILPFYGLLVATGRRWYQSSLRCAFFASGKDVEWEDLKKKRYCPFLLVGGTVTDFSYPGSKSWVSEISMSALHTGGKNLDYMPTSALSLAKSISMVSGAPDAVVLGKTKNISFRLLLVFLNLSLGDYVLHSPNVDKATTWQFFKRRMPSLLLCEMIYGLLLLGHWMNEDPSTCNKAWYIHYSAAILGLLMFYLSFFAFFPKLDFLLHSYIIRTMHVAFRFAHQAKRAPSILYVTDGMVCDNTGVIELLRRRSKCIFAVYGKGGGTSIFKLEKIANMAEQEKIAEVFDPKFPYLKLSTALHERSERDISARKEAKALEERKKELEEELKHDPDDAHRHTINKELEKIRNKLEELGKSESDFVQLGIRYAWQGFPVGTAIMNRHTGRAGVVEALRPDCKEGSVDVCWDDDTREEVDIDTLCKKDEPFIGKWCDVKHDLFGGSVVEIQHASWSPGQLAADDARSNATYSLRKPSPVRWELVQKRHGEDRERIYDAIPGPRGQLLVNVHNNRIQWVLEECCDLYYVKIPMDPPEEDEELPQRFTKKDVGGQDSGTELSSEEDGQLEFLTTSMEAKDQRRKDLYGFCGTPWICGRLWKRIGKKARMFPNPPTGNQMLTPVAFNCLCRLGHSASEKAVNSLKRKHSGRC